VTDAPKHQTDSPAESSVRDSGPVEGGAQRLSAQRTSGGGLGEPGGSPSSNPQVPPAGTPAPQGRDTDVAALQAERDELFDRLQRLAAEFDNFRKRSLREQAALSTRANERLVKELLPILDDLGRALEAAAEHEEAKLEEGVRLVHRSLADLLAREGVAEIATDGKFDPHVHEALLSQPADAEEGSVIEVVQKGYKLGDRVIRPARVVVAGAQSGVEGEPSEDQDD
jgi:molecular chaperone GrpE